MEGKIPLIGDKFPEMEVVTTHGKKKLPGEYKGKWWILFSHPADFTPVCTTEFYGFQKRYDELRKMNCELIGLSIDQVYSHIKWTEWIQEKLDEKIEFPIIADHGKVADILGLVHPNSSSSTVRAVFFVDPEMVIRAMIYYPAELGRNMDEIVRAVKAFQVSDKNGVAMPANWPENELIQDQVIIPPPSDEKGAEERRGKDGCFDWWFCYKKL